MGRVLLTDWEGPIATALVRALLADPGYDVRVLAPTPPPAWVAESCEVVHAAMPSAEHLRGCATVVDLAACRPVDREALAGWPLTLGQAWQHAAAAAALAACEAQSARLVHVGAPAGTLDGAGAAAQAARGAAALCSAAEQQAGIAALVLWPFGPLWPGVDAGTPGSPGVLGALIESCLAGRAMAIPPAPWRGAFTAVEDIADGVLAALASDARGSYDLAGTWQPDGPRLGELARELTGTRRRASSAAAALPELRERAADRAGARAAFAFSPKGPPRPAIEAIAASLAAEAIGRDS